MANNWKKFYNFCIIMFLPRIICIAEKMNIFIDGSYVPSGWGWGWELYNTLEGEEKIAKRFLFFCFSGSLACSAREFGNRFEWLSSDGNKKMRSDCRCGI